MNAGRIAPRADEGENMDWNMADIWEAVAGVIPDEPALIHEERTVTWAEFDRRSNALARRLIEGGAKTGDKVSIYSYNRTEWMESVAAAFKARLVPVNVNFRYKDEELLYLFDNSDSVAVIFEGAFGENVSRVRDGLDKLQTFIQLDDGSPLMEGAIAYEEAVAGDSAALGIERSREDLLFIYTGGTTGMPKGVMWQQGDLWAGLGEGGELATGQGKPRSMQEHLDNVREGSRRQRLMPACPLMHGTGLFTALNALGNAGTVVTNGSKTLDAHQLWRTVEKHRVNAISIVGDVFARPMLAALEEKSYDLDSLLLIVSSGVMWSSETKQGLLEHHPNMILFDSLGSSEGVGMGASMSGVGMSGKTARFDLGSRSRLISDDGRVLEPGSKERGRIGVSGPIPVGYYKDEEKTAATFPVIDGVRYSVPGDYATYDENGKLVLLGRGSQCINSGGEKIYPEEVEEVLKRHPRVEDAAVVGVPDPKWGQAVTALVTVEDGGEVGEQELREHVRSLLADYKTPKRAFCVDSLGRSPSGKMDYKKVTERAKELSGRS